MIFNDKEIKVLAKARLEKHKELNWNRKYTIPFCLFAVVAIVSILIIISAPTKMVMVNSEGSEVIIDDLNYMVVNETVYIRDRDKGKSEILGIMGYVFGFTVLGTFLVYYKWYREIKRPFVEKFIEHYKNTGELLE